MFPNKLARIMAILYSTAVTSIVIFLVYQWREENPVTHEVIYRVGFGQVLVVTMNLLSGILLLAGAIVWYGWKAFLLRLVAFAITAVLFIFSLFSFSGVQVVYAISFFVAAFAVWPRQRKKRATQGTTIH